MAEALVLGTSQCEFDSLHEHQISSNVISDVSTMDKALKVMLGESRVGLSKIPHTIMYAAIV